MKSSNVVLVLGYKGWSLVEPKIVCGGPAEYRGYIAGSKAEFMVPKQMYVDTNSGLLSDGSVYYFASGRPVLARDTGISHLYPTGEGLLTFSTLEEAATGVEAINRDYARHARAGREVFRLGYKHPRISFSELLAVLALATVTQITENLCIGA